MALRPTEQGISVHAGRPIPVGVRSMGVPVGGYDYPYRKEEAVPKCVEPTKAGEPCKAKPVNGETACVGHLRQRKAKDDKGSDTGSDTSDIGS